METIDKQKLKEMYDKLLDYYQKGMFLDFLNLYKKYEEASGIDNINAKIFFCAGKVMSKLNRIDEAEKFFNLAVMRYAVSAPAFYELGAIYEKGKDYYQALEYYELSLKYSHDNYKTKSLMAIGNLYTKMGRYEEAIGCFEYILLLEPDNVKVLNKMGNIFLLQKNYEKARKYLKKALKIDSLNLTTIVSLGKVSYGEGDFTMACNYFENAISINEYGNGPTLYEAYLNLANTYISLGDENESYYLDAEKMLRDIIASTKIQRIKAFAYVYLGDIKRKMKKFDEAEGLYLNAIKANCYVTESYFRLADLFMMMNREMDARRMSDKAILLEMKDVKYFLNEQSQTILM